jgi:hypothetical protein
MKESIMRRYPSPSLVVSIAALIISLGGAGYSATGSNFILGQTNTASTQTVLSAPGLNGPALRLDNLSTPVNATALSLNVRNGHPPFTVSNAVKVANLNADLFDGLDSISFPRALTVPFNLAPGANSAPIALPADRPVFVMGVTTTDPLQSVGQVTLLRTPGSFISWTGLESPNSAAITSGFDNFPGRHIVFIDVNHEVDIEVDSADTIRIHNGSTGPRAGNVTLIW